MATKSFANCLIRPGLRPFLALALALFVAACGHSTQVTSGKDYLSGYGKHPTQDAQNAGARSGGAPATKKASATKIDAEVREAVDVEPMLRFPARIGIARLRHGQLAPIGSGEGEAWMDLAKRLGPDWGEAVPISPLIAALASKPDGGSDHTACGLNYRECLKQTMREVRLGAARQHVDAVLVYEAFAQSEVTSNPIAVTKLALIGFFLPSEDVEATGFAHAVLVDVRNGYTYGTASARADKAQFALASSFNEMEVAERMNRQAETAATHALVPEVEAMLRDLRLKLAEMRAK